MLINCVAYQEGRRLADVPVTEIASYVARPDCFVWVALRDGTKEELAQMQQQFCLHELAVEDALHGHQRPKIEEFGDITFVVMQTLELTATDELSTGEVDVFVGRNFLISVRNRSRQPLLGVRTRAEREPHLLRKGPVFVLYALMDAVVDRYFPIVEALETELESIEGEIFQPGSSARANVKRLYALKQRVTQVRHAVLPLLDAVAKLSGERVPTACTHAQEYFRDVVDHLERIQGVLESLRETIATAIQVNLSLTTIEESEVTKRLAAWAGVFAVATFMVGIWGMNFEYMPELKHLWGYPAALALIAAACAVVWVRFRRVGWL
jgi:magnesium transporter